MPSSIRRPSSAMAPAIKKSIAPLSNPAALHSLSLVNSIRATEQAFQDRLDHQVDDDDDEYTDTDFDSDEDENGVVTNDENIRPGGSLETAAGQHDPHTPSKDSTTAAYGSSPTPESPYRVRDAKRLKASKSADNASLRTKFLSDRAKRDPRIGSFLLRTTRDDDGLDNNTKIANERKKSKKKQRKLPRPTDPAFKASIKPSPPRSRSSLLNPKSPKRITYRVSHGTVKKIPAKGTHRIKLYKSKSKTVKPRRDRFDLYYPYKNKNRTLTMRKKNGDSIFLNDGDFVSHYRSKDLNLPFALRKRLPTIYEVDETPDEDGHRRGAPAVAVGGDAAAAVGAVAAAARSDAPAKNVALRVSGEASRISREETVANRNNRKRQRTAGKENVNKSSRLPKLKGLRNIANSKTIKGWFPGKQKKKYTHPAVISRQVSSEVRLSSASSTNLANFGGSLRRAGFSMEDLTLEETREPSWRERILRRSSGSFLENSITTTTDNRGNSDGRDENNIVNRLREWRRGFF